MWIFVGPKSGMMRKKHRNWYAPICIKDDKASNLANSNKEKENRVVKSPGNSIYRLKNDEMIDYL